MEVRENAKGRSNERQKLARLVGNTRTRSHARDSSCTFHICIYVYECADVCARACYAVVRTKEERAREREEHRGDPNYASASGGEITLNAP